MTAPQEFAAFLGIDWADEKHDLCLLSAEGGAAHHSTLAQKPAAIAAWAAELRQRYGSRPVAVCLEQSRGALIGALMQYEFLVLFPLNPQQLAAYRQALSPSGAKDDRTDAELLAQFLRDHPRQLRAWRPDDEVTRGLRLLTEQRRRWVEDRVARGNELVQRLKESYPLALEFSGAQGTASSSWPSWQSSPRNASCNVRRPSSSRSGCRGVAARPTIRLPRNSYESRSQRSARPCR